MPIRIQVYARVHPTEVPATVAKALTAFFPDATAEEVPTGFRAFPKDWDFLRNEIRRLRIPDTARSAMIRGREAGGRRTRFHLNKQAASVGRLNVSDGNGPLGDIEVAVEADTPELLEVWIGDVAPDTTAPGYVDPRNPDPDALRGWE